VNTVGTRRIAGLALAGLVFAADQAVKWLLTFRMHLADTGPITITGFFDLRYAQNFGVSFSMLEANSVEMRWILVAVTLAIAAGVVWWMLHEKARADILALGLVLGGALGNIRDRAMWGYVVDYADFHLGTFRPFAIFNLADAAISIGVVIILARSFLSREKREHETGGQTA
jgi:signal peptidase II